jgi:phospholipid/cholesterol/gamma-HCH transport system permease protein
LKIITFGQIFTHNVIINKLILSCTATRSSKIVTRGSNVASFSIDRIAILFGASTREALERLGSMGVLFIQSMTVRQRWGYIVEQMMLIGLKSLPIVLLASIFTGFITTYEVKYLAGDVFGLRYLGMLVIRVVLTELGPTLIGLVLAGRIGAKLAAEVGSMRVTEQIDAMVCLSLDPISYIVAPRIIAGFVMVPVLFVFGCIAAILSAQLLATFALDLNASTFYNSMRILFHLRDVVIGLIKSFVFGGLIALCGAYFGFYTTGGAVGVGDATRKAVVFASIMVLVVNLIISQLMM